MRLTTYPAYPSIGCFWPVLSKAVGDSLHECRLDVEETDGEYRVHAELPGIAKEQVAIRVEDNVLTIGAEFSRQGDDNVKRLRKERINGHVARSLRLPRDVNADAISAKMKDGVLSLSLPKSATARARQIVVK